jgi:hypothetical protein
MLFAINKILNTFNNTNHHHHCCPHHCCLITASQPSCCQSHHHLPVPSPLPVHGWHGGSPLWHTPSCSPTAAPLSWSARQVAVVMWWRHPLADTSSRSQPGKEKKKWVDTLEARADSCLPLLPFRLCGQGQWVVLSCPCGDVDMR